MFVNLVTVLTLNEEVDNAVAEENPDKDNDKKDTPLKEDDPTALAKMLDGYGADGHTLAHWCAKRGQYYFQVIFNYFNLLRLAKELLSCNISYAVMIHEMR